MIRFNKLLGWVAPAFGIAALLGATAANAAIIAQYTMEGTPPEAPTTVISGVTATNITKGTGVTVKVEGSNNYLNFQTLSGSGLRIATFTVTADALKLMDLDQPITLTFDARDPAGNAGGVRGFRVLYSYDGGDTFTLAGDTGDLTSATFTAKSFTIPDEVALPVAGTADLVIRLEGGNLSNLTGAAQVDLDNITLNGTVVAIPEPASLALLGLGSLLVFGGRRGR